MSKLKQIQAASQAAKAEAPAEITPLEQAEEHAAPKKRLSKLKQVQADNKTVALMPIADKNAIGSLANYQTAMKVDLGKIANQKTILDKLKLKQSFLPTYLPFVQDYVESGDNYPNSIAVQVAIWLLDINEIEHGLNLALHLVTQGQKMPDKIKRHLPTFLVDEMYEWASHLLKEDQGTSPYLEQLVDAMEQGDWDVHPLCWSKAYSMLAKHQVRNADYEEALKSVIKAEQRNPEKHGVKGLKAEIEKQLKALAE